MSIIAGFSIPSDEFALYETLVAVPEMVVEIERVVAHESDRIMPLFWTRGDSHADFEDAADDPLRRERHETGRLGRRRPVSRRVGRERRDGRLRLQNARSVNVGYCVGASM